jgi:hypothetical protein
MSKNHEFIIKMEGVNLSKEASQRIQTGINELLLQEFAGSGAGVAADGDDNFCGVFIPRKWIGRQVLVANLNRLQEIAKVEGNIAFITPSIAL